MWIRSQDKTELINCKRIQVQNKRIYTFDSGIGKWIELGEYATKERAIEILNDIEYEIKNYDPKNNIYLMLEK
jgi:hypothetical protein